MLGGLWIDSRRLLSQLALHGVRDRKDILALQVLAPLSRTYLPWSHTAMRPTAIVAILNEIVINARRRVVELGGGISTFYIARTLSETGGHLWTVEHDPWWAQMLACELKAGGLDEVVTVVHAPLAPSSHPWRGEQTLWYAEGRLREAGLGADGIDMLIIDGPPAFDSARRHARYPAVPFFADSLADNHAIVVDDIERRGEYEDLRRWERRWNVRFKRWPIHGTIAIGQRRP